jgi:hypothetical protein
VLQLRFDSLTAQEFARQKSELTAMLAAIMKISDARVVLQLDPRVAFLQLQAATAVHASGVVALLTILPAQHLLAFKEATPAAAASIILNAPAGALQQALGTEVSSVQQASLVGLAGVDDTGKSWLTKNLLYVIIPSVAIGIPFIVLIVFITVRRQRKLDAEQQRVIQSLKSAISKAAATPRQAWKDFSDGFLTPRFTSSYKRGPPSPEGVAAPTPHGGFGVFGSSDVPAATPHGGFGVFSSDAALPELGPLGFRRRHHSENIMPTAGHRISVTVEGDEDEYNSNSEDEEDEPFVPEVFHKGQRVWHPARGFGKVIIVNRDDPRDKPYYIEFDSGEVHCYSSESASKLRSEASVLLGLVEGAKVLHDTRGEGTIVKVDEFDKRGKPVVVRFQGGDEHHYSLESAAKLQVVTEKPKTPRSGRTTPRGARTPRSSGAETPRSRTPRSSGAETPRSSALTPPETPRAFTRSLTGMSERAPRTPKAGEAPSTPRAGEAPRTPKAWSLSTPRSDKPHSPCPQTPRSVPASSPDSPKAALHKDDGTLTQPLLHG